MSWWTAISWSAKWERGPVTWPARFMGSCATTTGPTASAGSSLREPATSAARRRRPARVLLPGAGVVPHAGARHARHVSRSNRRGREAASACRFTPAPRFAVPPALFLRLRRLEVDVDRLTDVRHIQVGPLLLPRRGGLRRGRRRRR